ncbi:MAG: flap endonuclease [Planctomycetes bacterium]|nr:flap endonuclease [Planctomycetota bacterium]
MKVHLIDGTYELFRHYFALPSRRDRDGREVGAMIGVVHSMLGLLREGATHVGVATDHVVESFRNQLWPGYKTGEGIEPELHAQFHPLEELLGAAGILVWPMVELEADDALAAAARIAAADPRVAQVLIGTPDKDLAQSLRGDRVVQWDRRKNEIRDAAAIREKFGVEPGSIPDYLALVGDSADGFPGIEGWGAKSAATVLAHYENLESIPADPNEWEPRVRGKQRLADNLERDRELAFLFRDLATLRADADVLESVDRLEWRGPTAALEALAARLGVPELHARAVEIAEQRERGETR